MQREETEALEASPPLLYADFHNFHNLVEFPLSNIFPIIPYASHIYDIYQFAQHLEQEDKRHNQRMIQIALNKNSRTVYTSFTFWHSLRGSNATLRSLCKMIGFAIVKMGNRK